MSLTPTLTLPPPNPDPTQVHLMESPERWHALGMVMQDRDADVREAFALKLSKVTPNPNPEPRTRIRTRIRTRTRILTSLAPHLRPLRAAAQPELRHAPLLPRSSCTTLTLALALPLALTTDPNY